MSQVIRGAKYPDHLNVQTAVKWERSTQHNLGFRLVHDDSVRVIRGGSCNVSPDDARAGFRFRYLPSDRDYSLGLRLVRKREGT